MSDIVLTEAPPPSTARGAPARSTARLPIAAVTAPMQAAFGQFRRHLWAFLAVLLIIPAAAWIAIQRTPPHYTATGALIYEPSEYKARELQSMLRADPITDAVMASQAELLRSLKVAKRVTDRGNLYANPLFNRALLPRSPLETAVSWGRARLGLQSSEPARPQVYGPMPDPARDATVQAVRDALRVAPVRYSHVLEVTFTAGDPITAAAAVNNAMDIYIKDQFTAKAAAVHHATAWLNDRAATLRREVRAVEDKIEAYRASQNLARGMHAGLDAEKITHLNEDLVRARAELAAADAKLDAARGRAGAGAQAAIAPSVVPLRANLEQLAAQAQAQTGRLGANHPDAESARRQVEDARRAVAAETARVVTAIDQDRRAASERVGTLETNLHDAERDADTAARARIPLNAMERDMDASRTQLQAVLERIQQTAQQHAIETSEAHEISLALPPQQPSFPRPVPFMIAAIGAGAFLGLILIYVLCLSDTTVQSGEDIRAWTDLPCFALIPELTKRDLRRTRIEEYTARRPLTAFAEQIRAVRAGLWQGTANPVVVAITAARPAEGKSILALSLARSASLSGEKVLLIDSDLRRPSLGRLLGAANGPGLADLLRGEAVLADVLHRDPLGGMHFLPAGQPGGDAFGLFMGEPMARLLTDARREYSLIVLDTPPVRAITEARVLAGIADAAVLCVRWRATPRAVLTHALELLEDAHAHVAGAVLTRVDPRAHVRSGYADAEVYHRRYKAYYTE